MDKRELAANIKQALTMYQVVTAYGFEVNRAGFIHCPFHAGDNQGSLKVYDGAGGFCCFGCDAKGSVIDFAMKLFGLNYNQACEKLNLDFNLCLPIGRKQTIREHQRLRSNYSAVMQQFQQKAEQERKYNSLYSLLWDLWVLYDKWRMDFSPTSAADECDPRYVQAVKNIDYVAHRIDTEL